MSTPEIGRFSKTRYLTGMRAYAAMSVFLIHSGGLGLRELGAFGNRLVDQGRWGVVVFFVLSAFTLAMSASRERDFHYGTFLLRRWLRIAPLYYSMCLIALWMPTSYWADHFGVQHDAANLMWHVTFLNLFDARYINSLIGVEWTIAIEMFFYLWIPLGVAALHSRRTRILLVCAGVALYLTASSFTAFTAPTPAELGRAYDWSPHRYLVCFIAGLLAYHVYRTYPHRLRLIRKGSLLVAILVAWGLRVYFDLGPDVPFYTALSVAVILSSGHGNRLSEWLLENPVAFYLGTISYSIYLVHVPVLTAVRSVIVGEVAVGIVGLLATVAVASVTYYTIERPFLAWGRRLGRRPTTRPTIDRGVAEISR